tara:strand:- start:673 stop:1098 length:426 start_codon:yes stop_codon:yes gene_type:complete
MIEQVYRQAMKSLVRETRDRTGIELPMHLELYITELMAQYVDGVDLDSSEAFATQYLSAVTQTECKTVGDRALMIYGWFPQRHRHRGVNTEYYSVIGRAAYQRCTADIFGELSMRFNMAGELMRAVPNNHSVKLVKLDAQV